MLFIKTYKVAQDSLLRFLNRILAGNYVHLNIFTFITTALFAFLSGATSFGITKASTLIGHIFSRHHEIAAITANFLNVQIFS